MAYQKTYARINWENYPSDKTPLNEDNLNKVDVATNEIDDRVIHLDLNKLDKTEAADFIKDFTIDKMTGVITVTRYNNTQIVIDTALEKIAVNFKYDAETQKLVLTLDNGEMQYIDLASLITQFEFINSETIEFIVDADGKVTAKVIEGSISEKHLRPDYLADIKVESAKAEAARNGAEAAEANAKDSETAAKASETAAAASQLAAAQSEANAKSSESAALQAAQSAAADAAAAAQSETNAAQSAAAAKASEDNAAQSEANASQSETNAEKYAQLSQSYAVGDTGTRVGEENDNAKEYARRAQEAAEKAEEIAGGDYIPNSEKGKAGGVATLGSDGKVPESQLPDDIGFRNDSPAIWHIGYVASGTFSKELKDLTGLDIGSLDDITKKMANWTSWKITQNSQDNNTWTNSMPSASSGVLLVYIWGDNSRGIAHFQTTGKDNSNNRMWFAVRHDSAWSPWKEVANASDVNDKVSKSGDTMTGELIAPNLTDNALTANRVVITNNSKRLASASVTTTELGYLAGVKSNIQKQIDNIEQSGGGGIPPSTMKMISVRQEPVKDSKKILINFEFPSDTVIDGQTVCTVKGCMVRIKKGSYPVDEKDGDLVVNSTVRGQYATTPYTYDAKEYDTYYISFFPYSDQNVYAHHPEDRRQITTVAYLLYGYRRTKKDSNPKTRLTATDMAVGMKSATRDSSTGKIDLGDWKDVWFVAENKPVMLKSNGTIDYYLNPDDLTKKADGGESDVANTGYDGNAMALFPTCWVKRWQDDTYEYFQVCNIQLNDEFKAYAHQRADGSVMEWFARSIFDAGLVNGKARSLSGLTPCNNVAGTTQLQYAKANGDIWDVDTWSRVALMWDLLWLMGLNDDLQDQWGYGYYSGMSQASHLKAAGTGNTKGAFYGKGAGVQDVVKVFNVENLWGNIWKLMQGLLYNTNGKYAVKMTPPYNNSGSDYTATSFGITGTTSGYQSAHNMSELGLLPTTVSGSETTYIPDGCWFNTTQQNFARFGSDGFYGLPCGAALNVVGALSFAYWNCGLGLTCEQPLAA